MSNWISWQARSLLRPGPQQVSFIGDTRLLVSRGMHGATGNIYCGLHEFEDMAFVLHFLQAKDLFVDVGANIGSYTVLASGVCGAKTIAVEPVSVTAAGLQANVALNNLQSRVEISQKAIGNSCNTVYLSTTLDCTNHVVEKDSEGNVEAVEQTTLDELLDKKAPALIKIDVEGYECQVLDGAERTLSEPALLAVIVEANGSGNVYGHEDAEIFERLESYSFKLTTYDPFSRSFADGPHPDATRGNALFMRDHDLVQSRVKNAPNHDILGQCL